MTQGEKDLLMKDLCARLPYGVKVKTNSEPEIIEGLAPFCINEIKIAINLDWSLSISDYTPYLRPMSSMTEEESREYRMFIDYSYNDFTSESTPCVYVDKINDYLDWLNAHYFDYRGLIEKGLALEAPENMYK